MTESVEQQVAKVIDDAVARRDPTLPTWAMARVTRLLRQLEADERREIVERICNRPEMPPALAADLSAAIDRAAVAAPPPPQEVAPPPPPPRKAAARAPRSASPRGRVQTRTFKGRTLEDIPAGTRVEYQGKAGVIEPPWLVLDDGRRFQYLNPAAAYVNGGVEVNGWDAWKVGDGRSVAECYDTRSWPPVDV